jgi:cytochrome c556
MQPRHLHVFGLGALAERLPEAARAALATQMHAHARGMMELVSTATVLDYEAVGVSVQRLLEEPRVARPLIGDATELNAELPARFFGMQDELRADLQSMSRAAAARDPEALADSFAATSKACIRCHDSYLTGR